MFVLVRAIVFAVLFIGFVLVFVPARILSSAGIVAPAEFGIWPAVGMLVCGAGAALAIWCVLTFAFIEYHREQRDASQNYKRIHLRPRHRRLLPPGSKHPPNATAQIAIWRVT